MKNFTNKYRPSSLSQIYGNKNVINSLKSMICDNVILNSYIVYGSFGIGKTTISRILQKAFNCENFLSSKDVCLSCNGCKYSTFEGLEVDAASKRGILDTKEMINSLYTIPSLCRYRVIILDEAHMFTTESFNYLLSIIEEPPIHLIFVFITTEIDKIPKTIDSRCFKLILNSPNDDDIHNVLKFICNKEKIDIKDDTISFIINRSKGSIRNAIQMLEFSDILYTNNMNFENAENFDLLHKNLINKKIHDVLDQIDSYFVNYFDPKMFFRTFLQHICSKKHKYYNIISETFLEYMFGENRFGNERFFWVAILSKVCKII